MSVQPFNFQKPGPLAGAQEHRYAAWLKSFCAWATRGFKKELPGAFELQIKGSEALRAADALAGVAEGTVGYHLAISDKLPTILLWPRPVVLGIVGALLGDTTRELAADRELTVVEDALFEFFLKSNWLISLRETWHAALLPELGAKEANPRFLRMFAADESLIVSRFILRTPFGDHAVTWLLPKRGLLEALPDGTGPREESVQTTQRLERLVPSLPVPVTITLGTAHVRLTQLAKLRPGDVLVLEQRINQPLPASVAGIEKMQGWPGRVGNRQAYQIEILKK